MYYAMHSHRKLATVGRIRKMPQFPLSLYGISIISQRSFPYLGPSIYVIPFSFLPSSRQSVTIEFGGLEREFNGLPFVVRSSDRWFKESGDRDFYIPLRLQEAGPLVVSVLVMMVLVSFYACSFLWISHFGLLVAALLVSACMCPLS